MAVSPAFIEALGWTATAVFVGSYFARPSLLNFVQMAGALLWMAYGVLQHALPVVVANLLVFAAAGWTAQRARREAVPSVRETRLPGEADASIG
jgi:hypothetical protein